MFMLSAYPAPVLRWRQGPVMSGFLTFMDRYRDEAACIAAMAELRWPNGFHLRRVRRAAGLSTGGSTAGFRMRRLRTAAFGDRRDGLSPHPHAAAQMVDRKS